MGRTTYSKLRIVLAALAVALITVAPAASAPDVPQLVGPNDGDTVAFLPVFSWDPVAGADKYNFVLSADSAFNSPVYQVNGTKDARTTPDVTQPNGTYYWRVQAVDVRRQHVAVVGDPPDRKAVGRQPDPDHSRRRVGDLLP